MLLKSLPRLSSLLLGNNASKFPIAIGCGSFLLFSTSAAVMAAADEVLMDPSIKKGKDAPNIFAFKAKDIDGNMVDLAKYKIYEQYAEKGLRILAFPCNQFGKQEPKDEPEIKAFAQDKYHVTFDLFSKINVNGSSAHPLYDYLKDAQGGTLINAIKWNFTKFVVDKEGKAVARFGPTDDPIPKVEDYIKKLL